MKDLSLHILDVVGNSVAARAGRVDISIVESGALLTLTIADDGYGMDKEFLSAVTDPYKTSRTTRKVGLGLPLLKQTAEQAGGNLSIESEPGVGTRVEVTLDRTHIDAPPLGDLPETLITLIQGAPDVNFYYMHKRSERESSLNTEEIRQALDGVPLNEPEVLSWIFDTLKESEESL